MSHYMMLTRVSPEAIDRPGDLEALEKKVSAAVEAQCPQVRWITNYAVMGPYDYVDLFEAPEEETAVRVALIVRSFGHATTELWPAIPWKRFRDLARDA